MASAALQALDSVPPASAGGLIAAAIFTLTVSFLCSLLEASLLSTTMPYVEMLVAQGSRPAKLMQKHRANLDLPISAILTLNTIANTFGAAAVGAEATQLFGDTLFGVISAVLTLAILVFSEIIPKTVGATYWRAVLPFGAVVIEVLVRVLRPLLWLLQNVTVLLRRSDGSGEPAVSKSELEAMADLSQTGGALAETENRMLKNLLRLSSVQVYDIMTPRTVVFAISDSTSVDALMATHKVLPYSRIPIFTESLDDCDGFVLRTDILGRYAEDNDDLQVSALKRPMHSIPETLTVDKVLDQFIATGQHILLAFDEYGGTSGVITMEDALELLLGAEIRDETDAVLDMRAEARRRFAARMSQMGMTDDLLNRTVFTKDDPDAEDTAK
jgi:CBS domain containing-hemolysin-like protein